jgi:hypothetical protein
MTPVSKFSCETSDDGYRCTLYYEGKVLRKSFEGGYLKGAWKVSDKTLLLIDDANGFEDRTNLHLLDAQLNWLESAHLGSLYSPGETQNMEVMAARVLTFTFPDANHRWQVEVLPLPQWRLPKVLPWTTVSYSAPIWRTQLRCQLVA